MQNQDAHLGNAPTRLPRKKGWDYDTLHPQDPRAMRYKTRIRLLRLRCDLKGIRVFLAR